MRDFIAQYDGENVQIDFRFRTGSFKSHRWMKQDETEQKSRKEAK